VESRARENTTETRTSNNKTNTTNLNSFALGLYIPPGFMNIRYAMFIIFGLMCFMAAAQFYITYPETAHKTLEEIEEMFAPGGPKAWKTKRGESRLDALLEDAVANRLTIDHVGKGAVDENKKRAEGSVSHQAHVEDVADETRRDEKV
jgi:hypothetical protein